jgi:hypothetical protein
MIVLGRSIRGPLQQRTENFQLKNWVVCPYFQFARGLKTQISVSSSRFSVGDPWMQIVD